MNDSKISIAVNKPIILIGMMGAGKTTIGARLAQRLGIPFIDADEEIEKAAQMEVSELFEQFGEDYFRDGERRVIERLLSDQPIVLATGGGAFMDPRTRALIRKYGHSIWLRVPIDELERRVKKRPHKRPLLQGTNIRERLETLSAIRDPIYSEADLTCDAAMHDQDQTVETILSLLGLAPPSSGDTASASTAAGGASRV